MEPPIPSALEGSEFLREWHARFPGLTSATFWYGRIPDGRSSYAMLVDDVAALPRAETIIDLACGDGYLLALIAKRFPSARLIGVDMSGDELELARRRNLSERIRLVEARAEALPLADAGADAAVCHMALMLFDDPGGAVRELARVIRPGGIFAAALGPARGNSELVARFGAMLREAETAEELPPLQVGNAATYAEDSLRALFPNDAWSDVRTEQLGLRVEGSDDQIEAMLLSMYNIARLSEDGRAELTRKLRSEILQRRHGGQATECVLGLRHLVARRSG